MHEHRIQVDFPHFIGKVGRKSAKINQQACQRIDVCCRFSAHTVQQLASLQLIQERAASSLVKGTGANATSFMIRPRRISEPISGTNDSHRIRRKKSIQVRHEYYRRRRLSGGPIPSQ